MPEAPRPSAQCLVEDWKCPGPRRGCRGEICGWSSTHLSARSEGSGAAFRTAVPCSIHGSELLGHTSAGGSCRASSVALDWPPPTPGRLIPPRSLYTSRRSCRSCRSPWKLQLGPCRMRCREQICAESEWGQRSSPAVSGAAGASEAAEVSWTGVGGAAGMWGRRSPLVAIWPSGSSLCHSRLKAGHLATGWRRHCYLVRLQASERYCKATKRAGRTALSAHLQ